MEKLTVQEALARKWPKPSKYRNIKTMYNGYQYHSKKEAQYAQGLDLMKKARGPKRVLHWGAQVPYKIVINEQHICTYIADFIVKYADGTSEVVDVKSSATKTDVYRLKKKLMKVVLDIDIVEV